MIDPQKYKVKYVIQQRNGDLVRIEPDNRCAIWTNYKEALETVGAGYRDLRIMKLTIIQYGHSAVVCVGDVEDEELYGSFVLQQNNDEWLQFKLDEWIEPIYKLFAHSNNLFN